jgi:phenylalanyl-tRNA synthetase beta chain
MKVPLSWLREYLDLTLSPEELAQTLTLAGVEVEGIETTRLSFSGVVVGAVLRSERHPHADRLSVATVTDGKEEFQVVCGAPNCRAGIKVAFAAIGATLSGEEGKPFKIKKSKLRDVESFGMLCSADELGLGEKQSGIMELPNDLPMGADLSSFYSETILDISLTPNLGHCMSIYGLAREISSLLNLPLKQPPFHLHESEKRIEEMLKVYLIDKKQCLRYACRAVMGITVSSSPEWLKRRLESCGLRSINNVVDVGNLVMLAYGQPLHMFDADRIEGNEIIVTADTSCEALDTLDGLSRSIAPGQLLICDKKGPLAFAGVMGGARSAVSEHTKNVLIEAACFTPQAIRKSARLLSLKTDSSQRFEKEVDPEGVLHALHYAAFLLQTLAGGTVVRGAIDLQSHPFHKKKITCRVSRVNAILGTQLSTNEIALLLRRLRMEIVQESSHDILVEVPSFRTDISTEIELIEDIAKIYGYHNIPKTVPRHVSSTLLPPPIHLLENEVRGRLIGQGLQELITCDLISPRQAEMSLEASFPKEALLSVIYSHSVEQSVMRASLLPGLLQVVKYNLDHTNPDLLGFEVGRIHFREKEKVMEPTTAGIILTGKRAPYHWNPKPQECDVFDLKGIVENLLMGLGIEKISFDTSHLHNFHPGRQARIKRDDLSLGVLGEVHPAHLKELGIEQRVFFAEINLNELIPLLPKEKQAAALPLFPGSERDWTVTIKEESHVGPLLEAIRAVPSRLLEKAILLDLYKSEQIGKDSRNATFRFFYRDPEKTIAFETVEREHARITQAIAEKIH